ncbi:DeoR family transcriptional regulator [Photobacterium profundum]
MRRDLSELKEKGILELFFGGARLIEVNKAEKFRAIEKRQVAF